MKHINLRSFATGLTLLVHDPNLSEAMGLALVLWLCGLVAVGLIASLLFGPEVARMVAVGLLVALVVVCLGICAYDRRHHRSQP